VVSNDYVVTYEEVTNVLVCLNAGIAMIENGEVDRGLRAVKRAKEQLRDYRGMKHRAGEVTEAVIQYLQTVAAEALLR